MATLLAKAAPPAKRGEFEPFKTSLIFDSTASHPEWLGEEPKRVCELIADVVVGATGRSKQFGLRAAR